MTPTQKEIFTKAIASDLLITEVNKSFFANPITYFLRPNVTKILKQAEDAAEDIMSLKNVTVEM